MLGTVHAYAPWAEESATSFFTFRRTGVPEDALTIGNLAHDMFKCNFDNVMFCGRLDSQTGARMRKNIVVCAVVATIAWASVSFVVGSVPVVGPMLSTVVIASMIALVPVTAIHLAYGMSPMCFPMVPTCAVADLVYTLQAVMPMNIWWPDSLQRMPGCLDTYMNLTDGDARAAQQSCMLSCREEPFSFKSWEDSAAWALCSVNAQWCATAFSNTSGVGIAPNLGLAAERFSAVILDQQNPDAYAGHTYCFVVTLGQALPAFFAAVVLFYLVLAMARIPFVLLSAGVQLGVQMVAYTHAHE